MDTTGKYNYMYFGEYLHYTCYNNFFFLLYIVYLHLYLFVFYNKLTHSNSFSHIK